MSEEDIKWAKSILASYNLEQIDEMASKDKNTYEARKAVVIIIGLAIFCFELYLVYKFQRKTPPVEQALLTPKPTLILEGGLHLQESTDDTVPPSGSSWFSIFVKLCLLCIFPGLFMGFLLDFLDKDAKLNQQKYSAMRAQYYKALVIKNSNPSDFN